MSAESDPPQAKRSGVGFAAMGMIYNQAVTAISGVLIGRIVGATDFGIANVAKNLFTIVLIMTPLGLDLALQRYMGSGEGSREHRLATLSRLRLLAMAVALIPLLVLAAGLAPWLHAHVYPYRDFAMVLIVTFAVLPFATDAAVTGGAYRGERNPAPAVMGTYVLVPTARVLLSIALFLLGWRLWAIVAATAAAQLLSWFYVFLRARRDFVEKPVVPADCEQVWRSSKVVLGYSWAMCIALLVTTLTKSVDVLVLAHYRPSDEVGRYAAAQLLVSLLIIFSVALGQTLGARVSERHVAGDMYGVEHLLRSNARLIGLVVAPLYAMIVFWGDRAHLILGESFDLEWKVIVLLATSQFAVAILSFSGYALSMTGRHKREAGILLVGLVVAIALNLLLVPRFGDIGAAFATLCAVAGTNVIRARAVRALLNIKIWDTRALLPAAIAVAIAGALRLALDPFPINIWLSTIAGAGLTGMIYALIANRWLLTAEDRKLVPVLKRFSREKA